MSDPLNQNTGRDARRGDQEKILGVLDLAAVIVRALFSIFGRRKDDKLW